MPQGMQLATTHSTDPGRRAEPIRRRTLVLLRWIALGGQLFAIIVARLMQVEFATVPALLVVAIAAALNLWMTAMPARVTQSGAAWQLVFDEFSFLPMCISF